MTLTCGITVLPSTSESCLPISGLQPALSAGRASVTCTCIRPGFSSTSARYSRSQCRTAGAAGACRARPAGSSGTADRHCGLPSALRRAFFLAATSIFGLSRKARTRGFADAASSSALKLFTKLVVQLVLLAHLEKCLRVAAGDGRILSPARSRPRRRARQEVRDELAVVFGVEALSRPASPRRPAPGRRLRGAVNSMARARSASMSAFARERASPRARRARGSAGRDELAPPPDVPSAMIACASARAFASSCALLLEQLARFLTLTGAIHRVHPGCASRARLHTPESAGTRTSRERTAGPGR